jgi:hypothetical protein
MKITTAMRFAASVLGVVAVVCLSQLGRAQTAPASAGSIKSYEIDVPGTKEWVDTNVDLRRCETSLHRHREYHVSG